MRTLGQENLGAEFHRLQCLAALDPIGVRREDRIEFLFDGNRLALPYPAPRLVDDTDSACAQIGDLLADCVNHRAGDFLDLADAFGGRDHGFGMVHHSLADRDEFAVLGSLLLFPLTGGPAWDGWHAATGAARAIGKPFDSPR